MRLQGELRWQPTPSAVLSSDSFPDVVSLTLSCALDTTNVNRWLVARSADGQYGKVPENYLQCADDTGAEEVSTFPPYCTLRWPLRDALDAHAPFLIRINSSCRVFLFQLGSESDEDLDDDVAFDGSPRLALGPDGGLVDDQNGEYDVLPKLNLLPPTTGSLQ